MLWVLWKFWEEEHRQRHSRRSEESRLLTISTPSSSPFDYASPCQRQDFTGWLRPGEQMAPSSEARGGRN
jgi:hypothetical protein